MKLTLLLFAAVGLTLANPAALPTPDEEFTAPLPDVLLPRAEQACTVTGRGGLDVYMLLPNIIWALLSDTGQRILSFDKLHR